MGYTFDATDDSGVQSSACTPAPGTGFAVGSTPVHCTATDVRGNTTTADFAVIVSDTTPPAVTAPAGITVAATNLNGAVVSYSVSATDLVDGSRPVTCSRASGSTFAIGDTLVSCTSTDTHGNTSPARTFNVHVDPPADTTVASCAVTGQGVDSSGKKYADMTVRDTGSGLASIGVLQSTNAITPVPAFTVGTTAAVIVRATKINQSQTSVFELRVKDMAGNSIDCDPTSATLTVKARGGSVVQRMTRIPAKEHQLRIDNGRPGLSKVEITVNGKRFKVVRLKPGRTVLLDLAKVMRAGNNNTITVKGTAKRRGFAMVLISD